jgi:hypothetical protein
MVQATIQKLPKIEIFACLKPIAPETPSNRPLAREAPSVVGLSALPILRLAYFPMQLQNIEVS